MWFCFSIDNDEALLLPHTLQQEPSSLLSLLLHTHSRLHVERDHLLCHCLWNQTGPSSSWCPSSLCTNHMQISAILALHVPFCRSLCIVLSTFFTHVTSMVTGTLQLSSLDIVFFVSHLQHASFSLRHFPASVVVVFSSALMTSNHSFCFVPFDRNRPLSFLSVLYFFCMHIADDTFKAVFQVPFKLKTCILRTHQLMFGLSSILQTIMYQCLSKC